MTNKMQKMTPEGVVDMTPEEIQEVEDDRARIIEERAANQYREDRRAEYPPIGDQLDAIMKWAATESEISVPAELKSIAMKCMSVKAQFPKPETSN